MCLEGNSAALSVRYVSAQLQALWENAKECAEHAQHYDYKSAEYEHSRYIRALREFHYLTRRSKLGLHEEDLFFSAKFAAPEIKFLCNHTLFFCLKLESGHLNLLYKDATKVAQRADKAKNIRFENLELVFMTPILRSNINGRDEKIGNLSARHLVQMMVLGIDQAKFIMIKPDDSVTVEAKEALGWYMRQYLSFLQLSGNHVMFDLPDFDDNRYRPHIDYTLIRTTETDYLRKLIVHDIKILEKVDCSLISQFYNMHWQNACGKRNGPAWGSLELCLATISSDWIIGGSIEEHFFINFKSPTVEPICSQEVILKFNIKELGFFEKAGIDEKVDPKAAFFDWQFAFIVKCVKAEGLGVVTLDLSTARFSHFDSYFGEGEHSEEHKQYIQHMITFFSIDYLDIISRYHLHVILGLPVAPEGFGREYQEEWTETDEGESDHFTRKHGHAMMWSERIQNTFVYPGFDEVVALSEESINRVLHSRLSTVRQWYIDGLFAIDILDLRVRLLTNGKAIVYITTNGSVAVRKREKSIKWWTRLFWQRPHRTDQLENVDFETITLAYEVNLAKLPHDFILKYVDTVVADYFETWTVRYWEYLWSYTIHEHSEHQTIAKEAVHLMHFVLNLETARYVEELSNIAELGTGEDSLEKLNTIRQYIPEYMAALTHYGHNILHTVPICKSPRVNEPLDLFAFTDVDFRVLTKKEITIDTCLNFETFQTEIPLMIIYGVTGGRQLPAFFGQWTAGWQPVGRNAVGVLGLSHELFLERYILNHLKTVNAMTTIVPLNVDVVDDKWHVDLTTWYLHPTRSKSKIGCQWSPVPVSTLDYLQYEWKYRDEWNHEHEGNAKDSLNGEYHLSCNTTNTLIVPTAFNPQGLELDLRGETSVKVGGKFLGHKWSRTTVGTWGAKILLDTSSGGLKIVIKRIPVEVKPVGETPNESYTFDPSQIHYYNLALKNEVLDELIITELRKIMEASWEYCKMGIQAITLRDPVFTRKGDLICELDLFEDMVRPPMLEVEEWVKYRTRWYSAWVENGKLRGYGYAEVEGEYTRDKDGNVDTRPIGQRGDVPPGQNGSANGDAHPPPVKPNFYAEKPVKSGDDTKTPTDTTSTKTGTNGSAPEAGGATAEDSAPSATAPQATGGATATA